MDGKEIEKLIDAGSPIAVARRIGRDPHRVLDFQWARALYRIVTRTIGEQRWSRLRRVIPPHVFLPDHERLEIFRSRTVVSIDRARTVLAWEPRYDIDSGMERTRRFVNWARL
jgi:nucleoside-diphosphate-sugar epimerase